MADVSQEYLNDLTKFLNNPDEIEEPEEALVVQGGLAGNISFNDIRSSEQALLYIVVDKSGSMYNNGLEQGVIAGLKEVKNAVNGAKESKNIETAMTFFGSTLDMRPFQYGENIDISYSADEPETRLYDAIVESCNNMVSQYDKLRGECVLKGVMLIFTDGEENGSQNYKLKDAQNALAELEKRGIPYIVAAFKDADLSKLAVEFEVTPVEITDEHQLRRLMGFVSKSMA